VASWLQRPIPFLNRRYAYGVAARVLAVRERDERNKESERLCTVLRVGHPIQQEHKNYHKRLHAGGAVQDHPQRDAASLRRLPWIHRGGPKTCILSFLVIVVLKLLHITCLRQPNHF